MANAETFAIYGKCMRVHCYCQKGREVVNLAETDAPSFLCDVCQHDLSYHAQQTCYRDPVTQQIVILQEATSTTNAPAVITGLERPPAKKPMLSRNSFPSRNRHASSFSESAADAIRAERDRTFAKTTELNSGGMKSKDGSMKKRATGGMASSPPDVFTRDVVLLKNDHDGGIPNVKSMETLLNTGQMKCDVEFNKRSGVDVKTTIESTFSLLLDHDYRFLNREGQQLIETVYNKDKQPSHSTLFKMYKVTRNKTYPILIQSAAFDCTDCSKLSSALMGGDMDDWLCEKCKNAKAERSLKMQIMDMNNASGALHEKLKQEKMDLHRTLDLRGNASSASDSDSDHPPASPTAGTSINDDKSPASPADGTIT